MFRRSRALFVSACLLWTLVTPIYAFAQKADTQSRSIAKAASCTTIPQHHLLPLYRGLTRIHLYIDFPPALQYALDCRGHERECALSQVRPGMVGVHAFIPREVNLLQDLSNGYPEVLYPDHLANIAKPLLDKLFAPLLMRTGICTVSDTTSVYRYSDSKYMATASSRDVFSLILHVTLVTTATPHIVVLTLTKRRPGTRSYLNPTIVTAIALNQPTDQIDKTVTHFFRDLMIQSFQPLY